MIPPLGCLPNTPIFLPDAEYVKGEVTNALVSSETDETIRDSLLMSILSPTRRSFKNRVPEPTTDADVAVTVAVPIIRVFAVSRVIIAPEELTFDTVAAAE